MGCKVLFYDYKDSERKFFEKNTPSNFCIKFFTESLNSVTVKHLTEDELISTHAISVKESSCITPDVLEKFKNLRVVSTRSQDYSHIDILSCMDRNIAVVNIEKPESDLYNLNMTFKGITGVLCGDKESRVV